MGGSGWWDRATVERLLRDLIAATVQRLRPGQAPPDPAGAAADELGPDALGLDSLERLELAQDVATFFRLYDTGEEERLLRARSLAGWVDVVCGSLSEAADRLTLRTGGTTGSQRAVTHSVADLAQEAAVLVELMGPRQRVVGFVPAHHIYGLLFTVFLPQALGAAFRDARPRGPGALPQLAQPGDLVVAVPALWRLAARTAEPWAGQVGGVTATAPCPDDVVDALVPGRLAWLLQVYGSTETAGIGYRFDRRAPYRLLPYWTPDSQDTTCLWRRHADGTRSAVAAPDRLDWVDDAQLRPAGRHDRAVQVAGVNVYPGEVERFLAGREDVAEAAVRPMAAGEGERLKAWVVPADADADPAGLQARLNAALAAAFPPESQPRSLRIGAALPRDALGKLVDWPAFPAESAE